MNGLAMPEKKQKMGIVKKIAIGVGSAAALVGGIIYLPRLFRLKSGAAEMDVIPKGMIHKVDISGITVRLDVQLKNPTNNQFKFKYPYIRLSYKGTAIGTSQSVNEDIGMKAFGEVNIQRIMVHIPTLGALSTISSMLKAIKNNEQINMEVKTLTQIDPYWLFNEETKKWERKKTISGKTLIPYKVTKPITLREKKETENTSEEA